MSTALRAAALQLSSGDDIAVNLAEVRRQLAAVAAGGAALAVLPENFAAMGADETFRAMLAEPDGDGPLQAFLRGAAREFGLWIVGGTLPLASDDPARPYASCIVVDDHGERRGRYDKLHLFDVDVPEAAESWRESATTMPGTQPLVVDTPWGGLAVAVCYDLRFPEQLRDAAGNFSMLTIPAAFTYPTGQAHWHTLLRARAIENLAFVVAAAQTGTHPGGRRTYGHATIIGPWGDTLAAAGEGVGSIGARLDLDAQRRLRTRFPALTHRRRAGSRYASRDHMETDSE